MKFMTQTIIKRRNLPSDAMVLARILIISAIILVVFPALAKRLVLADLEHPLKNLIQTPYGPQLKNLPFTDSSYDFANVKRPFGRVNLERVGEIKKHKLEDLILSSLDLELRKRLRPHLTDALEISEKYELDPYWVLAIMWTESHYVHSVKSNKNAHGLMQVLPSTAKTLTNIQGDILEPSTNIEMGAHYLRKLLDIYSNNYQVATVAYNQGPGNVKKKGKKVLLNNQYLIKVRNAYMVLTVKTNDYFKKLSPPFEKSFIERNHWVKKYFEKVFSVLPKTNTPKLVYSNFKKDRKSFILL